MKRVSTDSHATAGRAPFVFALLVAAMPVAAACQQAKQQAGQRLLSPGQQAKWSHDSAQYLADSAKWVRDSIVLDSISRTINTDSLFREMHRMLAAPDPAAIVGEVECVHAQIPWRYGDIPGLAAIHRMMDTVWKRDDNAAVARMYAKLNNPTLADQQKRIAYQCEKGAMGPAKFNGTSLDAVTGRPERPTRP